MAVKLGSTGRSDAAHRTGDRSTAVQRGIQAVRAGGNVRTAPVVVMAVFGAVTIVFSLAVWARWLFSGELTPIDTGPDPIPTSELYTLYVLQAGGFILLAGILVKFLIVPWLRERRISNDGLLLLAMPVGWFVDPFFNYTQHWLTYNAHLLNLGSWGRFVPGWVSPHQERFPEPLLVGGSYLFWIFGCMLIGCAVFKALRARYPSMSTATFFGIAFVFCCTLDLALEFGAMRLGWFAEPGASLAIFSGRYKMSMIEILFAGIQMVAWICLRYYRDDHGYTIAERGVDSLRLSPRSRTVVRWLALTGALSVLNLMYNIPIQTQGLHSDRWPKGLPSYLTYTCPEYKTNPDSCGGPGLPIARR